MIQNLCYISVTQWYIEKNKEVLFVNENSLILFSEPPHFRLLSKWFKNAWAEWLGSTPCVCQWDFKFGSGWILYMEMQNIGPEPLNTVYWWSCCCLFNLEYLNSLMIPTKPWAWALPHGICSPGNPLFLVSGSRMGPCSLKFLLAVAEIHHE